jgi:hypothetical protein
MIYIYSLLESMYNMVMSSFITSHYVLLGVILQLNTNVALVSSSNQGWDDVCSLEIVLAKRIACKSG